MSTPSVPSHLNIGALQPPQRDHSTLRVQFTLLPFLPKWSLAQMTSQVFIPLFKGSVDLICHSLVVLTFEFTLVWYVYLASMCAIYSHRQAHPSSSQFFPPPSHRRTHFVTSTHFVTRTHYVRSTHFVTFIYTNFTRN